LEKSVLEQMTEYTERNNLIDKFQSGFRRAHGTGTALLHIVEKIRYAINDKMLAIVVLLDNTKAFDSLDHDLFYHKLYKLNFADSVVNWFKSYFYNRKQCVIGIDKKRSNWDYVNRGCGQGTILGPFIFTVYTYDIGGQIKYCEYHVYADDTQLYIFTYLHDFNHNVDLINEDLARLSLYFKLHGLLLNAKKCQAIVIGHPNVIKNLNFETCSKIIINNVMIPYEVKVKNLGLIIDRTLSWASHVSYFYQRVIMSLKKMYRFRKFTPV
jgi:hypothetical protein